MAGRHPQAGGYQGESRYVLLDERLPNPTGRPPMVAFNSALAGEPVRADERPRMRLPSAAVDAATAAAGVRAGAYWTFAPGAEYGPAKCWPAERYAALARSLFDAHGEPVCCSAPRRKRRSVRRSRHRPGPPAACSPARLHWPARSR